MNNQSTHHHLTTLKNIAHLEDFFSVKQQSELIKQIGSNTPGLFQLLDLLIDRRINKTAKLSYIDGTILKYLHTSQIIYIKKQLHTFFEEGVVELKSSLFINYKPLYSSLLSNNLQEANLLTNQYLQELAGLHNNNEPKRQWLYFTDIITIPSTDLNTIDTLWRVYSGGKFGFSIQRQIWLYNNKSWDKLWNVIGWKINNTTARYPNDFTWNYNAPQGHLPLFNQLRGVQVLSTLFMHPAFTKINSNIS